MTLRAYSCRGLPAWPTGGGTCCVERSTLCLFLHSCPYVICDGFIDLTSKRNLGPNGTNDSFFYAGVLACHGVAALYPFTLGVGKSICRCVFSVSIDRAHR
ncbi:unnamed protein product [Ectocarpus sp. 13 AM-2016]